MKLRLADMPNEYRGLADEFATWYIHSKPGDRFLYYLGEHLNENAQSIFLRRYVWEHACEGKVYIFQSRDTQEPNKFNFIAVKPRCRIERLIPLREASEKRR